MVKKKTFEQCLNRLENIIKQIEENDINLEECVKLYKDGIDNATKCMQTLKSVEQEVLILQQNSEDLFELNPFDNHYIEDHAN